MNLVAPYMYDGNLFVTILHGRWSSIVKGNKGKVRTETRKKETTWFRESREWFLWEKVVHGFWGLLKLLSASEHSWGLFRDAPFFPQVRILRSLSPSDLSLFFFFCCGDDHCLVILGAGTERTIKNTSITVNKLDSQYPLWYHKPSKRSTH